jgi:hypothetical protein
MPSYLEECEALALKLCPQERAALAARLIDSLDSLKVAKKESFWVHEKRYQAYQKGYFPAKLADEARRDALIYSLQNRP